MTLIENLADIIVQVEQAREDADDMGVKPASDKLIEALAPLASALGAARQHDFHGHIGMTTPNDDPYPITHPKNPDYLADLEEKAEAQQ